MLNLLPCCEPSPTGPSQEQADKQYGPGKVTVVDGIQKYIVPTTGNYLIELKGASGGNPGEVINGAAIVHMGYTLKKGDILYALVGLNGKTTSKAGGGGGGTFLAIEDPTSDYILKPFNAHVKLLGVAGGSGGYQENLTMSNQTPGRTTTEGGYHNTLDGYSRYGGEKGQGGLGERHNGSSGGGGFLTDGTNGEYGGHGRSFLNGGVGGTNVSSGTPYGGFGGGASTHGSSGGGGGAGGYSGGGGGAHEYQDGQSGWGGGGGSYSVDPNATFSVAKDTTQGYIKFSTGLDINPDYTTVPSSAQANFNKVTGNLDINWAWADGIATVQFEIKYMSNFTGVDDTGVLLGSISDKQTTSVSYKVANGTILYFRLKALDAEGHVVGILSTPAPIETLLASQIFPKVFTGATGPRPPENIEALYTGTALEGLVTGTKGIQEFIIVHPGVYTIIAAGARGTKGGGTSDLSQGGKGAELQGKIRLQAGDKLKVLVGQVGKDNPYDGGGDSTTGAGGGGTFIELIRGDAEPVLLIAAAGGNGGCDGRYPGNDGKVVHGSAENDGKPRTSGDWVGGGYAEQSEKNTSGYSYKNGGNGSTNYYERGYYATAGFGGGGANRDDNNGGGGGGYHGGAPGEPACSYINTDMFTDIVKTSGKNNAGGFVSLQTDDVFKAGYIGVDTETNTYYVLKEHSWEVTENVTQDTLADLLMKTVPYADYKAFVDAKPTHKLIRVLARPFMPTLTYYIECLPKPIEVILANPIGNPDVKIAGLTIDGSDDITVKVSFDGKATWVAFDATSESWKEDQPAMSIADINGLSEYSWSKAGLYDNIYLKLTLAPTSYNKIILSGISATLIK